MPRKRKETKPEVVGFVGVGLDNEDGHQRVRSASADQRPGEREEERVPGRRDVADRRCQT